MNAPSACLVAYVGFFSGAAMADCTVGSLARGPLSLEAAPPKEIDLSLRPEVPECLIGLSGPQNENCPRQELEEFGNAVEAWSAALHQYVNDTNRYANEVTQFANSVIEHARTARQYADAALDFAECEAAALAGSTN